MEEVGFVRGLEYKHSTWALICLNMTEKWINHTQKSGCEVGKRGKCSYVHGSLPDDEL